MRFVVVVKTHNPLLGLRMSLLDQTLDSVDGSFPGAEHKWLIDNGSSDGGLSDYSRDGWELYRYHPDDGNHTPGRGANNIRYLVGLFSYPYVAVLSDDDMFWHSGAESRLRRIWGNAPDDLAIVCGLLEPVWEHNKPIETIECGGERILVRSSVPGAAWSFRDVHVPTIFPVKDDFGYDTVACGELTAKRFRVAALDLATHEGWGASTHGNDMIRLARPLDRERWGV